MELELARGLGIKATVRAVTGCFRPSNPNSRRLSSSSESSTEGCLIDLEKILEDKNRHSYHTQYTWPTRFNQRESRKQGENINPESVASFGKKSNKPIFEQRTERRDPKQNNGENGSWNFHFVLGKERELVQVWVFGPESQVKVFTSKIILDKYFVFWGQYSVPENKCIKICCDE